MQRRHILGLALLATSVLSTGCKIPGERGSGTAASESRSVGTYNAIELHGAIDLDATVGGPAALDIEADDNLLPLIETKVEGNTLIVRPTKSLRPMTKVQVTLTTEKLEAVTVHGASDLKATGIDTDTFTVEAHGASDIELSGQAKTLKATAHGASGIEAEGLTVTDATVQAHGASHIDLASPDSIDAELHGASHCSYEGSPSIDQDLHGASSVKKR